MATLYMIDVKCNISIPVSSISFFCFGTMSSPAIELVPGFWPAVDVLVLRDTSESQISSQDRSTATQKTPFDFF